MQPERSQAGASTPNQARVYDFLLGGKDNFAADRALAEKLEDAGGEVRELARINRSFILSAARWSASMLGISQFLDLGCGLPSKPAVHDVARGWCQDARVVYADHDPVVLSHVAALQSGPGLLAVLADVSEPASLLRQLREPRDGGSDPLIDLAEPACVIFGGTLSAMTAQVARDAVTGFAKALAPGSAVIISCASYADPETGARMAELYSAAGRWHNHGYENVEGFFLAAGLRIVHERPMDLTCWPACPLTPQGQAGAVMLGGIGIIDEGRER